MPNILIVEDDININNLLCEVLMKAGYTCEQAFSGTEAKLLLNIYGKFSHDCIFILRRYTKQERLNLYRIDMK